jgi:TPR repeat protein/uncharacterized protein YbaR (Trm112 family)
MDIEMKCPDCDGQLAVDEEHLGNKVQCPYCEHQFVAGEEQKPDDMTEELYPTATPGEGNSKPPPVPDLLKADIGSNHPSSPPPFTGFNTIQQQEQPEKGASRSSSGVLIAVGIACLVILAIGIIYGVSSYNHSKAKDKYQQALNYFSGNGIRRDFYKGLDLLKESAKAGYAPAQYQLGVCYLQGQGFVVNYDEAFKWFSLAADQDYAPGLYAVSECYGRGCGVRMDVKKAVEFMELTAEKGHMIAQRGMALFYATGFIVPRNIKKALELAQKAYDQNPGDYTNNLILDQVKYLNDPKSISDSSTIISAEKLRQMGFDFGKPSQNGEDNNDTSQRKSFFYDSSGRKPIYPDKKSERDKTLKKMRDAGYLL